MKKRFMDMHGMVDRVEIADWATYIFMRRSAPILPCTDLPRSDRHVRINRVAIVDLTTESVYIQCLETYTCRPIHHACI